MNRALISFMIGLVMVFVIQVLYVLEGLSTINFEVSPVSWSMYVVPTIFFLSGFFFLFVGMKKK